jgi:hypothetical protein
MTGRQRRTRRTSTAATRPPPWKTSPPNSGPAASRPRLITPDGHPPSLAISNPEAVALSETVMADAGWFWWPWADRIAGVADVPAAADLIARVLATAPGGPA